MNLKEILKYGKEELIKNNIEDASIIAKELAEHIFKITRAQMIANNDMEFSKDQTDNYINSIKKISTGIPIQYITNNQEFMNLNFYVDENVLIPQPDTETLVEEVINEYKEKKCEILDLCTGSGAIAISLAKYINESNIVASDISMKALQIAKLNAEKNLVRKKIEFIESDMFNKIYKDDFDIIVSNPPYIRKDEIKKLNRKYKKIRDGYQIKVRNTQEATELIVEHQELFRDYEVVKGGMDDVFLAVTGKKLGGER